MDPIIAHLDAFFADISVGAGDLCRLEMSAMLGHGFLLRLRRQPVDRAAPGPHGPIFPVWLRLHTCSVEIPAVRSLVMKHAAHRHTSTETRPDWHRRKRSADGLSA